MFEKFINAFERYKKNFFDKTYTHNIDNYNYKYNNKCTHKLCS